MDSGLFLERAANQVLIAVYATFHCMDQMLSDGHHVPHLIATLMYSSLSNTVMFLQFTLLLLLYDSGAIRCGHESE